MFNIAFPNGSADYCAMMIMFFFSDVLQNKKRYYENICNRTSVFFLKT